MFFAIPSAGGDAEDHAEVLVVAPADITGTFYGSGADNAVATALGTVATVTIAKE